jgi:hypothetical protein
MKSPHLDERTGASLRRRLLATPAELRAMATAETADWQAPDFETDEAQQEAMHALLRACSDARVAVFGPPDSGLDDDDRASNAPKQMRRWVATERLTGLDRAIADGICAGRMLRQRGLKTTLTTSERFDTTGEIVVARAEMGFRRRASNRRAA